MFLAAKHKFRSNMDIVTMVVAWGLELGDTTNNVQWVVRSIVEDEWLLGLNSVLEWAIPGAGFDVNEGFEDPVLAELHGLVPFMRWLMGFNRDERQV